MTDDDVNVGWVGHQHRAAEDLELVVCSEQKSFAREQRYLLNRRRNIARQVGDCPGDFGLGERGGIAEATSRSMLLPFVELSEEEQAEYSRRKGRHG